MNIIKAIFNIDDIMKNTKCNVLNIPSTRIIKDVIYDESNPTVLTADLFMPETYSDRLRVLVNIHGGGWISGDKKWRIGFSSILCDNKHFVMNINYGLSPEYKYPYCIANAMSALRYINSIAQEYNLDLDNVYIGGDSAGAQIASMVAAVIGNKDALDDLNIPSPNINIKGLILFCGAYDMQTLLKSPMSLNLPESITGHSAKDITDFKYLKYMDTSEWVNKDYPPCLIVVAKLDTIVPNQEKKFVAALDTHHVPYHLYISKRLSTSAHCFHLYHTLKDSKEALELAKKHLEGNLIHSDNDNTIDIEE